MSVSEIFSQDSRTIAPNYYDLTNAPFTSYIANPLTTTLQANNNDITNIGTGDITNLEVVNVALRAGSLETAININDNLRIAGTKAINFAGDVSINADDGIKPVVRTINGNLPTIEYAFANDGMIYEESTQLLKLNGGLNISAVPSGSQPNVLGYDIATGNVVYQASGGGGGSGNNAYATFNYSDGTLPIAVDSWYFHNPSTIAFSNNGSSTNVSWLNALQTAFSPLNPLYITITQNENRQLLEITSIAVDGVFTYCEFVTAEIPPPYVVGGATNIYFTLAGNVGATGADGQNFNGSWKYDTAGGSGRWYVFAPGAISVSTVSMDSATANWLSSLQSIVDNGSPCWVTLISGASVWSVLVNVIDMDEGVKYLQYTQSTPLPVFTHNDNTDFTFAINGYVGATGASGFSQALANKLLIEPVGTIAPVPLTWSLGQTADIYVPLLSNDKVETVAPINPASTGTGWRFSKTYNLITVAVSGLTTGSRYTIVAVGTVNWLDIGAPTATVGTQFTYNGVAITGSGGTATENKKISWYSLNALYGLALPQSLVPSIAVKKKNLRNAWVLIKMNADCALQGALAIQIETYAYQFGGNGSNDYTSRWAYSFPQNFNAGTTTNITTSLTTPRLKNGFIYLLYAGDISPSVQPSAGLTYATNGATLFAPSQVSTENTLRDPYDVYPQYPHLGLTSSTYVANATSPAYGGSSPYTDPADVEVASIYLNTNSTSPTSGVGQTVFDFNVLAFGYSGVVEAGNDITFAYECSYV